MDDRNFTHEDLEMNRTWAALGYLLFFIPLIKCKGSRLGRYCANQGLILFIIFCLVRTLMEILSGIPLIGWVFSVAGGLVTLGLAVIGLLCMVQLMTHDRVVELPFVGFIRLIRM